jgi:hypothetical protein
MSAGVFSLYALNGGGHRGAGRPDPGHGLWEHLTQAAGADARDAVWQHPDLLPGAEDLDEPAGFIDRVIGGDTSGIDEAIAKLEEDPEGPGAEGSGGGGVDN